MAVGYAIASNGVAPFAGAWIEILSSYKKKPWSSVAPFAGAWIEIIGLETNSRNLPAWCVAPFAGAWIETKDSFYLVL